MATAIITKIQRMSLHDGPGIRSTIFLKGCNLRCKWCHNPETFEKAPEIERIDSKCISCYSCIEVCEPKALKVTPEGITFNKADCDSCFKCVEECYPEAIHKIGNSVTAQQLLAEIEQDIPFFNQSSGGVTFSGGEAMMQIDFLEQALKLLKQSNIHTAIETNMSAPWQHFERVLPYLDYVMADIKLWDSEAHKQWTGVGNSRILTNIKNLDDTGVAYVLRTPVIPGVNDNTEALAPIVNFVSQLNNCLDYQLLPFHQLGESKYQNLGMEPLASFEKSLTKTDIQQLSQALGLSA